MVDTVPVGESPPPLFMYQDWRIRYGRALVHAADPIPAVEAVLDLYGGSVEKAKKALQGKPPAKKIVKAVLDGLKVETTDEFTPAPAGGASAPSPTRGFGVDEYAPGWTDDLVADFASFCNLHELWPHSDTDPKGE